MTPLPTWQAAIAALKLGQALREMGDENNRPVSAGKAVGAVVQLTVGV